MKLLFNNIKIAFLQDIRYPVNFVFGILTSILSLIPIFFTIQLFGTQNDIAWYVSGLIIWMYLSQIIWGNGVILKNEKMRGTLEQLLFTPKSIARFICYKSLYFIFKALCVFFILINICNLFFKTNLQASKMFLIILIGFPFYYALSIIISFLCLNVVYLFPILQVVLGGLMIISGLTYEVSFLGNFNAINNINVIYQMIHLARTSSDRSYLEIILSVESIRMITIGIIFVIIMLVMVKKSIVRYKKKGVF